jgi:hypothetical protein
MQRERFEERQPHLEVRAINHIWGYVLKVPPKRPRIPPTVGATDVSNEARDVSLRKQRAWVQQAEDNVVERLFQAGLLMPQRVR